MSGIRYTAEFKAEAVKQVSERDHGVVEVANRLAAHKIDSNISTFRGYLALPFFCLGEYDWHKVL